MTRRTKAHTNGTQSFRPTDLFICEKCGHEFSISPSEKKGITCPKCDGISDKSDFLPLNAKRTLWISQGMLPQYYQKVVLKEVRETLQHC